MTPPVAQLYTVLQKLSTIAPPLFLSKSLVAQYTIFFISNLGFWSVLKLLKFSLKNDTEIAYFYAIFVKNVKICCLSLKNTKKSVLGLLNFRKNLNTGSYKEVAYIKNRVLDRFVKSVHNCATAVLMVAQ